MKYSEFKEALFNYSKEKGCECAEVFFTEGDNFEVNILNNDIDKIEICGNKGLKLRVKFCGKDGYAYTEAFDDPENLVDRAIDNASIVESIDIHPMQTKKEYKKLSKVPDPIKEMSVPERIDLAKKLEIAVKKADSRIESLSYCMVTDINDHLIIENTLGLFAESNSDMCYTVVGAKIRQDEEIKTGFSFAMSDKVTDIASIAKDVTRKCSEKLGASPIKAGAYNVIIKNEAMCELMECFWSVFSAENAQKGLSSLADKEGSVIASELVTIADEPENSVYPIAFDHEGTPCENKNVVENGILKTLLHNLKTAKKADVESTGNAGSSAIGMTVMPTNFYLLPGKDSYSQLVKKLNQGIIITELEGGLSGTDTVSGDFSLGVNGFYVEKGEIIRPVTQITVAGSFFELLKNITSVGNDLYFAPPELLGCFGSPSVLISKLMIAGK